MRKYIGVDPGKHGAISVIGEDNLGNRTVSAYTIPLYKNELDIEELITMINEIMDYEMPYSICMEKVHAIFGAGAKSTFEFGRIFGILEALFRNEGVGMVFVQPKLWQKEMFEGVPIIKNKKEKVDTKAMALEAAKRIFPKEDFRATDKCKIPHDGIVDSLLIAEYCRRHF